MHIVTYILLFILGLAAFLYTQYKAAFRWRVFSTAVFLILMLCVVFPLGKVVVYQQVQNDYGKGVYYFIGSLENLAAMGRTNDIVHACEEYQRNFYCMPQVSQTSNFWFLVNDVSILSSKTNKNN